MQKPILVGGLGLSLGLALLGRWQASIFDLGEWLFWGAIALGALTLWRQQQAKSLTVEHPQDPLKRKDVEGAIATAKQWVNLLQQEAPDKDCSSFQHTLDCLPQQFDRETLSWAIVGGRGTGKTSLLKSLQQSFSDIIWCETPPLFTDLAAYDQTAQNQVFAADAVIFLVNGDLMASQWDVLQHWLRARQRIVLAFNKQDQYQTDQRELILAQLRQHIHPAIAPQDVIAITAAPQAIKVKQIQADGTTTEHFERPEANLQPLTDRIEAVLAGDRQQLIWSTLWRTATLVQHNAKQQLNEHRKQRALPILEKYQWIAAGTAFANPVAALDLLATAAVTGQMIVDVGAVYQQKFSLSQAQTVAAALGKQMVQLGLVELSTQAVGGILKANALTYIAGGAVQGVSAAYLTRIAGLSLMRYFQEQDLLADGQGLNLEQLRNTLKTVFEQNQRSQFLQTFTKGAIARLSLQSSPQAS